MNYVDKDGREYKIDVENPREDKTYKIATDSFLMSAGADHGVLAPKEECENYIECKDYYACEYIKHLNKPLEINQTGRVHVIQ